MDIRSKVKVMARQEIELAYYNVTVLRVIYGAPGTLPRVLYIYM